MPEQIIDNHGRVMNYLRLSVTDRCNLRCNYCMPQEEMEFVPRKELLTYEEMLRLVQLFADLGIKKLRITGGEPFVRKDLIIFLEALSNIPDLELHITTNGVLTERYLPQLKRINLKGINLSLDTLDPEKFFKITRKNVFDKVLSSFHSIIDSGIPLKINTVVIPGVNEEDLISLASLAKEYPVEVRFIEEMPFDGISKAKTFLSHADIEMILKKDIPLKKIDFYSTAQRYSVEGWQGKVGVIPASSRTFCGACNRIRINATGKLKTCLYGIDVLDFKQLLNSAIPDDELKSIIHSAFQKRAKTGFEAEENNKFTHQSMSSIGG